MATILKYAFPALVCLLLFFSAAMYMGHADIVLEIVRIIIYGGLGGAGGYGLAQAKKQDDDIVEVEE